MQKARYKSQASDINHSVLTLITSDDVLSQSLMRVTWVSLSRYRCRIVNDVASQYVR